MMHVIYHGDNIIVALNGIPYIIPSTDSRFYSILEAVKAKDEEKLSSLLILGEQANSIVKELEQYNIVKLFSCAENEEEHYHYLDNCISMDLNNYLHSAIHANVWLPVVKFINRLFENPTHRTRMRLSKFMDKNKLPIYEDGSFIAYKAVSNTFMDKYSNSIFNGINTTVPLKAWSQIDTNNDHLCSNGYHVCSKEYLRSGFYNAGDHVISVSVPPEYVAAIPKDFEGSKVRCRQYTVLADVTEQFVNNKDYKVKWHSTVDPNFQETNQKALY